MILVFIISGRLIEAIKRLLMLVVDILLKIFNLFGVQINTTERRIRMSKEFKQAHKDVKIVKKSKENTKIEKSINIPALLVALVCMTLIISNICFDGCIVNWLWCHNPLPKVLTSEETLEITFTAVVFSFLSFSLSQLIAQWKATKNYRTAKKQMKQRKQLLYTMSSKELLDTLKQKDTEIYEKMKVEQKND